MLQRHDSFNMFRVILLARLNLCFG